MEEFVFPTATTIIICVLTLILAVIPWHLFNKLWLKPKRLEKLLISQGLQGDTYKLSLLMDNSKQNYMMKLQQEAKSKSIGLSKHAAPSIFSPLHQTVHKYGTYIYATLSFNFIFIPMQKNYKLTLYLHYRLSFVTSTPKETI
jgi:hypothetical protein